MKKREQILTGAIVGIVALFALIFGVRGFFLDPIRKIDLQTAALRDKLEKANTERREYFSAEDSLKLITSKTFGTDLNQASARSGEMVTKQVALAGLSESDFTRVPVGPRKIKGASEIGWSIQGKGDLQKIVNLMFLLEKSPQIHRLENVSLTSYDKPGEIKVRLFYLTLVVEPAPEVQIKKLLQQYNLDSPERLAYNTILDRDILRPYIKRPPTAPTTPSPGSPSNARPPGPESLKVVSLSEWEGQPEVHIRDLAQNKTIRYKPGDKLGEGQIVAVDYRQLPSSRSPILLSDSRVILKIGNDFWAIERGQTLADKHRLEKDEWPGN
jgi:hypothetical protein